MNISYEGIVVLMVTFPDNGSMEGEVCKLTAEGNVEYCIANDRFCGVCTNTTGQDYLVVQVDTTKKTVMIKL